MTDFDRITDDASAPGADLLRAARGDSPPEHVVQRTLAAVATVGVTGAVSTAAAAKAGVLGTKFALGFVAGIVVVGGAVTVHEVVTVPPARAVAPAVVSASAPREPAPSIARPREVPQKAPEIVPEAPVSVVTEHDAGRRHGATDALRHASVPAPAPSIDVDSAMELEVRFIDEARRDVAEGRARDALDVLRSYGAEAPSKRLAPEALYLEMEANALLGDRAAAARSAQALVDRYPNGPHAARARKILRGE